MKHLRKTIRKILIENQQHCAKLATMLMSGDIDNINQALELAETLEYVTELTYDVAPAGHFYKDIHMWDFMVSPELEAEIEKQYDGRPNVSDFNLFPGEGKGAICIRKYVDIK